MIQKRRIVFCDVWNGQKVRKGRKQCPVVNGGSFYFHVFIYIKYCTFCFGTEREK